MRRASDIRALQREGSRRRCGPLDVYLRPSATGSARAGIVVPRHGHTIIERNRLKRRIREIVRSHWLPAHRTGETEAEMLVRARPEAYVTSFERLREALDRCGDAAQ